MGKVTVFTSKKERVSLRHGAREVLELLCELPACECAAARHAREISKEIFAHARRVYFPQAAAELEAMVDAGCGFAFARHRLQFTARLARCGEGLCLNLSLCYFVGTRVQMRQTAQSFWDADGQYRRRAPKKVHRNEKSR